MEELKITKAQWCSGCAKAHAGAVNVVSKKCEGCGLKHPSFGLSSDVKKKRWCAGCAPKAARPCGSKMCEGCQLNRPIFGLPVDRKKRWCSGCAKGHAGAVNVNLQKKCEDCGVKEPRFRLPSDGNRPRWCYGCAKGHKGAWDAPSNRCSHGRLSH